MPTTVQDEPKPSKPAAQLPELVTYSEKREIWLKVVPLVEEYLKKQNDLIWDCLDRFAARMDGYKDRAGKFADQAMSLSTKWEFAKSWFSEHMLDNYPAQFEFGYYVHDLFEKHVISGTDIQREVKACITEYVEMHTALTNELVVKIQAALDDERITAIPQYRELANSEAFQRAFHQAFSQVIASVSKDTSLDVIRNVVVQEIGSAMAVRLATSIATRLGASEVIMGTGLASGAVSLGIGLVGGYALDWLVGEFLKAFADYDPERDIRDKVVDALEALKSRLVGHGTLAIWNAYCRLMIDDLYGMPDYPEETVKEQIRLLVADVEKNHDMGLMFQLMQYRLSRKTCLLKALASYFFGEDADKSCIGRYWIPQQRPSPEAILDRVRTHLESLKKGVLP